nr:unnamed protein product [Digitaria exilis]
MASNGDKGHAAVDGSWGEASEGNGPGSLAHELGDWAVVLRSPQLVLQLRGFIHTPTGEDGDGGDWREERGGDGEKKRREGVEVNKPWAIMVEEARSPIGPKEGKRGGSSLERFWVDRAVRLSSSIHSPPKLIPASNRFLCSSRRVERSGGVRARGGKMGRGKNKKRRDLPALARIRETGAPGPIKKSLGYRPNPPPHLLKPGQNLARGYDVLFAAPAADDAPIDWPSPRMQQQKKERMQGRKGDQLLRASLPRSASPGPVATDEDVCREPHPKTLGKEKTVGNNNDGLSAKLEHSKNANFAESLSKETLGKQGPLGIQTACGTANGPYKELTAKGSLPREEGVLSANLDTWHGISQAGMATWQPLCRDLSEASRQRQGLPRASQSLTAKEIFAESFPAALGKTHGKQGVCRELGLVALGKEMFAESFQRSSRQTSLKFFMWLSAKALFAEILGLALGKESFCREPDPALGKQHRSRLSASRVFFTLNCSLISPLLSLISFSTPAPTASFPAAAHSAPPPPRCPAADAGQPPRRTPVLTLTVIDASRIARREEVVRQRVMEFDDEAGVGDMLNDYDQAHFNEGPSEEEPEVTAKAYYDMLKMLVMDRRSRASSP